MSDMKCPICGTPLEYETGYDGDYSCAKCGRVKMFGSEELWQALTDSMKEYDLCHDALVGRTKELDRTRKALEIAKDTFNWIDETYQTGQDMEAEIWGKVQLAAQEITALEQKD